MLIKLPYRKTMPKICWQHYQPLLRPAGASQSAGCRQTAALSCQAGEAAAGVSQPFEHSDLEGQTPSHPRC